MHFVIACFGILALSTSTRRINYDTQERHILKRAAYEDRTAHEMVPKKDDAPVVDGHVIGSEDMSAKAANAAAMEAANIARIHREAAEQAVRGVPQAMNMAEVAAAVQAVNQARMSANIAAMEAEKMARRQDPATAADKRYKLAQEAGNNHAEVEIAAKAASKDDDANAVKQMFAKVHEAFREAGMPDDRIDYILAKWVKSVFPETLGGDKMDCYFDKECHAKVDWEKISMIKGGFFAHLKMYKEKDDASAVKRMVVKAHEMFREAGMPDDRIDYILEKWVRSVFAEALKGDKKDCYFDKECHAKVDWEKISEIKGGFFARLKMYRDKDDASAVEEMLVKVHEILRESKADSEKEDHLKDLQSTAINALPRVALLFIAVIAL